jgi:hypothetical protein
MRTVPLSPSTMRTRSGSVCRIGMKSTTLTEPSSVSQTDSRIIVSSRYSREVHTPPARGATRQRPAVGPPRRAAKHAEESNRGTHSQSTEPSRAMRAAVCRSATIP